jgi:hypothetical protein
MSRILGCDTAGAGIESRQEHAGTPFVVGELRVMGHRLIFSTHIAHEVQDPAGKH